MQRKLCRLCDKFQNLLLREEGQDLIEYALLLAVIALAAITGMQAMAGGVNSVFTTVATTFNTATG